MVVFEKGNVNNSMTDRWRTAAERLLCVGDGTTVSGSAFRLRRYQAEAFRAFSDLLQEGLPTRYLRMVLPPRSGKTVIVGQIIGAAQVHALFVASTIDLLDQTVSRLREQLPSVEIVPHYGDCKELTVGGIIVTTYEQMGAYFDRGDVPAEIASCAFIVLDEAHHVLTERRLGWLDALFDHQAVRIAITASPDWNESRQLMAKFPELIYELAIPEAVELGILAKVTAYVHEVDVGRKDIRLKGDDYDEEELERALLDKAMIEKVRSLRFDDPKTRGLGCLVCCKTIAQARAIAKALNKYRPKDVKPVACLTYEESPGKRKRIREAFHARKISTIVQIATLIEGWDDGVCKFLIDVAPTPSLVRATQKYYRPLTVDGDAHATIHMLIPSGMAAHPVYPTDVLYHESGSDKPFKFGRKRGRKPKPVGQWIDRKGPEFSGSVIVRSRIVTCATLDRPLLNKRSRSEQRAVILTMPEFDPERPPSMREFFQMQADHVLFRGSGRHLMSYLGVPITTQGYRAWLVRLFLRQVPKRYLQDVGEVVDDRSCREDLALLREITRRIDWRRTHESERRQMVNEVSSAWRALQGFEEQELLETPERCLWQKEVEAALRQAIQRRCLGWHMKIIERYFGINGEEEATALEIAGSYNLSRTRIDAIVKETLQKLSHDTYVVYDRATGELLEGERLWNYNLSEVVLVEIGTMYY